MKCPLLACVLVVLVAPPSWSHGGSYRGPADSGLPPGGGRGGGRGGPTGGPAAPGPAGPGPSTPPTSPPVVPRNPLLPMTGSTDDVTDPAQWQIWWSFNHDALLDLRARLESLVTSSGENPIVAERRRLQALLAPALVSMLQSGGKDSVRRQALLTLARLVELEELAIPMAPLIESFFARENPNLQEAALLALGIGGDPAAIGELRHVLMDDARGREKMLQTGPIPIRMRAFAAYALGLLGHRDRSEDSRRQAVHALLFALGAEAVVEREVRVACALALGLVPIQPCATKEEAQDPARQLEELHLCGGAQVEYLLAVAKDPKLDPWFRGHAAAALGRLARSAGPGFPASDDHPVSLSRDEVVRALLELAGDARGAPAVQRGCVLGLGIAADSDADDVDRDARELLLECTKRDDPLTQRFALLSLAAAFGRKGAGKEPDSTWKGGSTWLVREFLRAKEAWLPWYALALAVSGHGRVAQRQTVPASFVDALAARLPEAKRASEAAAYALALAVLRPSDPNVAIALKKTFEKQASPGYRAAGALALGLLGVRESMAQLEKALDGADSVEAAIAASLGLRMLGDRDVVPDLLKRLTEGDAKKTDDAVALVRALALLQDPSAGEPLLALVGDESRSEEVRCALLWCLGVLADPDSPDWTAIYANDLDYTCMPWTLASPVGDGRGLLDWR